MYPNSSHKYIFRKATVPVATPWRTSLQTEKQKFSSAVCVLLLTQSSLQIATAPFYSVGFNQWQACNTTLYQIPFESIIHHLDLPHQLSLSLHQTTQLGWSLTVVSSLRYFYVFSCCLSGTWLSNPIIEAPSLILLFATEVGLKSEGFFFNHKCIRLPNAYELMLKYLIPLN